MTTTQTDQIDLSKAVQLDNPNYEAIKDTGFYLWLKDNYNPFRMNAVLGYLEDTYNYMIGREVINEKTRKSLFMIYNYYTQTIMYPKWDKENS